MRRLVFVLGAIVSLGIGSVEADAQIKFGVHAAYIATGFDDLKGLPVVGDDLDLGGDFGAGARIAFSPPMLPIGAYASGTYYFPSCDGGDCSYWTAELGAQLGLPLPAIRPYVHGGWQWKQYDLEIAGLTFDTQNNPFFGVGVELNVLAGLFVEAAWEFNEDIATTAGQSLSSTPMTIKAGILFGG